MKLSSRVILPSAEYQTYTQVVERKIDVESSRLREKRQHPGFITRSTYTGHHSVKSAGSLSKSSLFTETSYFS